MRASEGVISGRIATLRGSSGFGWVEALAIGHGRVLAAGPRAEVEALGQVTQIVAPNHLHHLFLPDWAAAWPEARLHAAPGLRKKRAR